MKNESVTFIQVMIVIMIVMMEVIVAVMVDPENGHDYDSDML